MKISVIIPVKNGGATLRRCLQSIRSQHWIGGLEIIVLDSGSTDQSCTIAAEEGALIVHIAPEEFNHGLTRNKGVAAASGELLFFSVQDAWLSTNDALLRMSTYFSLPEVMAVVGHQAVPHEKDKNPFMWHRRYTEPCTTTRLLTDTYRYETMSQTEKKKLIAWDNVVAMYRKSALLELPFEETDFAEDWIWSRSALAKGWTLVYDPSILVFHYHHMDFCYVFRVTYTIHYHFLVHFRFVPAVSLNTIRNFRVLYHLLRQKELTAREKAYWILHNVKANAAETLSALTFWLLLLVGRVKGLKAGYRLLCKKVPQGQQKRKKADRRALLVF